MSVKISDLDDEAVVDSIDDTDLLVIVDPIDGATRHAKVADARSAFFAGDGLTPSYQRGSEIVVDSTHGPVKLISSDIALPALLHVHKQAGANGVIALFEGGSVGMKVRVQTDDGLLELLGGRTLAADGSDAEPSFAWTSNPATGIRKAVGVDAIQFICDGVREMQLTDSGLWIESIGSATAPTVKNLTHTQSGLYWGAGKVGLAVDALDVLTMQAPGGLDPQTLIRAGSEAKPGLATIEYPTSGLRWEAANHARVVMLGDDKYIFTIDAFAPEGGGRDLGTAAQSWEDGYLNRLLVDIGSGPAPSIAFRDQAAGWYHDGVSTVGLTFENVTSHRWTASVYAPGSNLAQDLGTPSLTWKDAYINRVLVGEGDGLTPSIAAEAFPATGRRWVNATQMRDVLNGADALVLSVNSHSPAGDLTLSSGDDNQRWSEVWTGKSIVASTGVLPEQAARKETFAARDDVGVTLVGWSISPTEIVGGPPCTGWVTAHITGLDANDPTKTALYEIRALIRSDAAGAVTISTVTPVIHSETPGWTPTVALTAGADPKDLEIQLTGDPARDMWWTGTVQWQLNPAI